MKQDFRLRISPNTWLALFALCLAVWITIQFAALIMEILALLFGAFLINLAIRPLAARLARRRIPRAVTVLGVYVLVLALLALMGTLAGTTISREAQQFAERLPDLVREAVTRLTAIPLVSQLFPSLDTVGQAISQETRSIVGTLLTTATGVGRVVLDLSVVFILAFFFVIDDTIGERLLQRLVPPQLRGQVDVVISNATERLSRWVVAQLLIIVYFSVVYGAGLLIIGVPFAILIALIGGLLEMVPFVGGAIALALSVLAALTVNPTLVIWVVILYAVVTQIEANIIQPQLYGHAVRLHPALVLVALLVGGLAGGILGALFAIPIVVVLTAILDEFFALRRAEAGSAAVGPPSPTPPEQPAG